MTTKKTKDLQNRIEQHSLVSGIDTAPVSNCPLILGAFSCLLVFELLEQSPIRLGAFSCLLVFGLVKQSPIRLFDIF
jgi:hypothetical protein